jgi:hypothetical protein
VNKEFGDFLDGQSLSMGRRIVIRGQALKVLLKISWLRKKVSMGLARRIDIMMGMELSMHYIHRVG